MGKQADNVIPLHGKCGSCGSYGRPGRPLTLAAGKVAVRAVGCPARVEEGIAFMAGERRIFEGLLAMGVSRRIANAMMVEKHRVELGP